MGRTDVGQEIRSKPMGVDRDCVDALLAIRTDDARDDQPGVRTDRSEAVGKADGMCVAACIDPMNVTGNTSRSTLAGVMRDGGAPLHLIQRQGRWKTPWRLCYARGKAMMNRITLGGLA